MILKCHLIQVWDTLEWFAWKSRWQGLYFQPLLRIFVYLIGIIHKKSGATANCLQPCRFFIYYLSFNSTYGKTFRKVFLEEREYYQRRSGNDYSHSHADGFRRNIFHTCHTCRHLVLFNHIDIFHD